MKVWHHRLPFGTPQHATVILAPQTIFQHSATCNCHSGTTDYLSALRNMQLSLGFPDPSSLLMLKWIQAWCGLLRGPPSCNCLPIMAHILRKIGQGWREALCPERAVWAVVCSAFFGFFRLGELPETGAAYNLRTSLSWGDMAVDSLANPRMVQFHLRRSKCDQAGKGADVVVGKTSSDVCSDVCPVSAILEWLAGWAIFLGLIEEASPEDMVCMWRSCAKSTADRVPPYGLRRAQFQDWGSHHGIAGGSMIQTLGCSFSPICQNPKGAAGHATLSASLAPPPAP